MIEIARQAPPSSFPITFGEWTGNRSIESVGTTAGLEPLAFQRWRNFKEAYAPEIVERAYRETQGGVAHIVDPFGGSGTTGLASQFLGAKPTLIEVNPYLADLINAKLDLYNTDDLVRTLSWVCTEAKKRLRSRRPVRKLFPDAPKTFIEPGINGQYIFSRPVAEKIDSYLDVINSIPATEIRRLFKVLLGSILISVSNVSISGKGRRYRRGWENRAVRPESVDDLFQEYALNAAFDLQMYNSRAVRDFTLLRGDSRTLLTSVDQIDLSVFSPPYPNSFDYTDVYNVELWMLGYLKGSESNLILRNSTLRSHVQINRDMSGNRYMSKALTQTIAALDQSREQLWNRHIPEMIAAYASDMGDIMSSLASKLRPRGRVYMVVGDSRYAGVYIPVAKVLTEISKQTGLRAIGSEACRSMRSSPQQGGREDLQETLLIFDKKI
jgi:hypothetical protein